MKKRDKSEKYALLLNAAKYVLKYGLDAASRLLLMEAIKLAENK